MRTGLLLSALSLLSAGCFTPIDPNPPRAHCQADSDCQVPTADHCAPQRALCVEGRCASQPIPPFWTSDPGACATVQDCECQPLPTGCAGSFGCVAGRCTYTCAPPCVGDADCPAGQVCDWAPEGGHRACQQGCREDAQCAAGERCVYESCARCLECPCFGQCQPVVPPECSQDSDCAPGEICGEGPSCEPTCVAGCRSSDGCGPGMACTFSKCAACGCANGRCQPVPGCADDAQCPAGEVCGEGPDCERACVPGCRGDEDCAAGEHCRTAVCGACGCGTPQCQPGPGCSRDAQCGPGRICGQDSSCDQVCVPGCRSDADCGPNGSCAEVACNSCGCNSFCVVKDPCAADSDCGPGRVCEPGTGCAAPSQCVPGCHEDGQCGPGLACSRPACFTCPCPGSCESPGPCHDGDGDGFVATCGNSLCDTLLGGCDCDDSDPSVYPTAPERCGDGRDDDCDGLVDEGCACAGGGQACSDAQGCEFGSSFCSISGSGSGQSGCCELCPVFDLMPCRECLYPGGYDSLGCPLPPACAPCSPCSSYLPVCTGDYATLTSRCEAAVVGAAVLHDGACAVDEGLACSFDSPADPCPAGQYCRNTCPRCASPVLEGRCTRLGACLSALDCPAGLPEAGCSGGFPTWSCEQHQCRVTCAP